METGDGRPGGQDYRKFYERDRKETYREDYEQAVAAKRDGYAELVAFIERFGLRDKRCLEIGSAHGAFQDLVADYWGTDVSESLARHYHKPYRVASGETYPFSDEFFDAIWTINVFEHIPHLEQAMLEIARILKPGGLLFFSPAWQCRWWAAEGYLVRPYSDFGLRGRWIKATIPIRDSVLWRSLYIFPQRLVRQTLFALGRLKPTLAYRKLDANYETFWHSDSDACNSIDPHAAILWFRQHGFECLSHPTDLRAFLVRRGPVIVRKAASRD